MVAIKLHRYFPYDSDSENLTELENKKLAETNENGTSAEKGKWEGTWILDVSLDLSRTLIDSRESAVSVGNGESQVPRVLMAEGWEYEVWVS